MKSFTQSQKSAIDAFSSFIKNDARVFLLKGAAGTGKTTLLLEFLRILNKENFPVRLMAPTGRAAYILSQKCQQQAFTIHKSIYTLSSLKPSREQKAQSEYDDELLATFGMRRNDDSTQTVYIIDEASMVSDADMGNEVLSFGSGKLLSDLFQFANGRKMIFVGDFAQLPPLGMNFSPALDKAYIERNFQCAVEESMLREVMRQADAGAILENATKVRECIENKSFVEFTLSEGEDSISEPDNLLLPYFNLSANGPCVKGAIITYSNRQALQYNLEVRKHYYGADAPKLVPGELLMIARNNYAYDCELFNGNIVRVTDCSQDVVERNVRVKTGKDKVESVQLRFRSATIMFGVNGKSVTIDVTLLDNFLDDPSGSVSGLLAKALIVDFNNRLPAGLKEEVSKIKRLMRSNRPLTTKEKYLCQAYCDLLLKDPYYNAVICTYGYAMTCHKAQGGEWNYIFVDMERFGGYANENYFRWAYTALTRASQKLWHYRSPDFNYISNIEVRPIIKSPNIKVSIHSSGSDFCGERFERILEACQRSGYNAIDDLSCSYQHRIKISSEKGDDVSFILWYNAKGYSGKKIVSECSSEEFAAIGKKIVDNSIAPGIIPYSAPGRPFAEKLVKFVSSMLDELDIKLLDITQEQYQDVFHLKTDGLAKMSLFYTDKGNYTHLQFQSSLGQADSKLEELRQRFIC